MKLAMIVGLTLWGVPANANERLLTTEFALTRSARAFTLFAGNGCLCSESASLDASGTRLTITDSVACAKDMEKFAVNWNNETDWPITFITGTKTRLKSVRHALQARLGKAPNQRLRFLSPQGPLGCLAFATAMKVEIAGFDKQEEKECSPNENLRNSREDPLLDAPGVDHRRSQSLINEAGGLMLPPSI